MAVWGLYQRYDTGADGKPVKAEVVVLPANPEDREHYKAKGFKFLGPAPQPGMEEAPA